MDGINGSGRRFVANKIYEVGLQLKLFCWYIDMKPYLNSGICTCVVIVHRSAKAAVDSFSSPPCRYFFNFLNVLSDRYLSCTADDRLFHIGACVWRNSAVRLISVLLFTFS